jgi:thioredoxin-related protein
MNHHHTSSFISGVVLLVVLAGFRADTRKSDPGKIEWLTIEQAYAKMQAAPRKVMIDVYTDWCGWCKVMDRSTFTDKAVAYYINKNFYAVKFNAEQKAAVMLGNQKFESRGTTHDLALALTNNQPSYPTTIFLDDHFQMIQPLPGYHKAREFHQIITFFGDNHYKKEPFESYKAKTYKALFPEK